MAGPGLYVWGGGSLRRARERARAGASIVAWTGSDRSLLDREGLAARDLADVIGEAGLAATASAQRGFARVWARVPLADGRSFRELVSWRGESLLWVAESYIRRGTAGPRCAALAETCLRLLEASDPAEVDASGLAPHEALLLSRAATARGVLWHGETGRSVRPLAPEPGPGDDRRRLFGRLAGRGAVAAGAPIVAVHDADGAHPLWPLLDRVRAEAGFPATIVAFADLARHETDRARAAADEAERSLRATLERLRGTPGLLASYAHRGVGFAELAALDLEAVLLGHLPGAVRVVERTLDVLDAARPVLALVAVEDRDRRRAVGLAAQAAGVAWATVARAEGPGDDRVDGGPQPLLRLAPGPDGGGDGALAQLRAAVRDSLGAR